MFQKQFIPFIKQVTGVAGASAHDEEDDDDEDVDYDELPFKIYKIECDNALTISKECNLLNYHEMKEKYDIEDEVDDGGVLEEFFEDDDENDNRYFFIENKGCFVVHYKKQAFYWKPHNLKDADDIDWDKEFLSMKKDICDFFGLINNDKFKMINGEDKEVEIKQGGDIESLWNNILDEDDQVYLKIVVNGDPLIEFVIDCKNIDNVSKSMVSFRVGLDIVSSGGEQLFLQFLNALSPACGIRSSSLARKYKLIDDCCKHGKLVSDAHFVKIYKTCLRKKISPIKLRLEQKVCCEDVAFFVTHPELSMKSFVVFFFCVFVIFFIAGFFGFAV